MATTTTTALADFQLPQISSEDADESGGKVGYVDVFTPSLNPDGQPRPELLRKDGLHLTPAGYEVWRDAVKFHLNQPADPA